MRQSFTTHLLCLFHLWLNLKECIRPVFRQGTDFVPEWRLFEHLFFTIAHQTSETEVDRWLEQMYTKFESWISSRSESNPSILERMPGEIDGSQKQSLADKFAHRSNVCVLLKKNGFENGRGSSSPSEWWHHSVWRMHVVGSRRPKRKRNIDHCLL